MKPSWPNRANLIVRGALADVCPPYSSRLRAGDFFAGPYFFEVGRNEREPITRKSKRTDAASALLRSEAGTLALRSIEMQPHSRTKARRQG